jgi:hypothetical protein
LCEVEFWEVLRLRKVQGFFNDGAPLIHRLTAN